MSYTNNDSLQELDKVLAQALDDAAIGSKHSSDKAQWIGTQFRRHIDNARPQLSEALYKVDLAMHGYDDGASCGAYEMNPIIDPITLSDDELRDKYIQKIVGGHSIYDINTGMWVDFSENSEISLTISRSADSGNKPAIHLSAYDHDRGTRLFFIDPEITKEDIWMADGSRWSPNEGDWREITYESPWANLTKKGVGIIGKSAGVINAYYMGQHYNHSFLNLRGLSGTQWRSLDGTWHSYQEIEQAKMPFRKQSLKNSHDWAKIRGKRAQPFSPRFGNICFVISITVSGINIGNAIYRDDSNKKAVTAKNTLDITMGFIAFIPGLGWAVSGTYFLMDLGGAFGNWGQASGFSRAQVDSWIARDKAQLQKQFCELDFEIDYHPPTEQMRIDMLRESHEFAKDKTYVQPKVLYQTKTFH